MTDMETDRLVLTIVLCFLFYSLSAMPITWAVTGDGPIRSKAQAIKAMLVFLFWPAYLAYAALKEFATWWANLPDDDNQDPA
jgi:hypothetical protein